jgi:hypothetical protein
MRAITITGYRRPHLFRDLLVSLRANDLAGWRVFVQVEPSPVAGEFAEIAATLLDGIAHEVAINPQRLGVRLNPFQLLDRVVAGGADLVLYLEEDLLLAPDTTRLALWYEEAHRPTFLCLSLLAGGCGSAGVMSYPAYADLLFPAGSFNSLGFVLHREQWYAHFRDHWMVDDCCNVGPSGAAISGWDWAISHHLLRTPDLWVIQPAAARSVHTGRENGEYCTALFHDLAFADLPLAPPSSLPYRLASVASLPGRVRRHALLWAEMELALRSLSTEKRLAVAPGAAPTVT